MPIILLVITRAELGGAQQCVLTLAQGLQEQGYMVYVASGEEGDLSEELKKKGISFYLFKNLRRTHNPLKNLFFIHEIFKFIRDHNITVVHLHSSNSLIGTLGVKLAKKRSIATLHGLSYLAPEHQAPFLVKFFYKYIFKILFLYIDKIIFVSQRDRNYALKHHLTSSQKSEIIYNGFRGTEKYFTTAYEAKKIFSQKINTTLKDAFIIGSIGRLAYPKNYEFLITHFPEIKKVIPNAQLLIIGEGPERKKYKKLIINSGVMNSVHLLGSIKEGYRYLKGFDLFILPSIYEGMSYVLIEALFAQIPVLVSRVGGNSEIVTEKNLFTANSLENLLKQLTSLQKDGWPVIPSPTFLSPQTMLEKYIKIY